MAIPFLHFFENKSGQWFWHLSTSRTLHNKKAKIFSQQSEPDGFPNLSACKRNYNSSALGHTRLLGLGFPMLVRTMLERVMKINPDKVIVTYYKGGKK